MVNVNEKKAAEILDVAVQTLRNWRFLQRGPDYLRLGRCIRYRVDDLENYVERNKVNPEGSIQTEN